MIIVDGTSFNVNVVAVDDTPNTLDKYAERTVDGALHREMIGVFPKYAVQIGAPTTFAERQADADFWEKINEPVPFHVVEIPNVIPAFECYFSSVKRSARKVYANGDTYWRGGSFTITARRPSAVV